MAEIFHIESIAELDTVAGRIIELLPRYRVIAFRGAMGAGKTTLIRKIARMLDVLDDVASPTFALVNQYLTGGGEVINHFDFYRIERIEEAFDMGYEEYFYGGDACLIEWPEKIESLLPEGTLNVQIEATGDDSRTITVR